SLRSESGISSPRVLLLRRGQSLRHSRQRLENPLPDQERLVRRASHHADRAAAGEPPGRPIRAAHGGAKLPALRGRKAMDGRAGVRVRATALGVVQGLPTTSEPSRLQSRRRGGASAASDYCRRTVAQDWLRPSSRWRAQLNLIEAIVYRI